MSEALMNANVNDLINYVAVLSKVNASGHTVNAELKKAIGMLSDMVGVTSYDFRLKEEAEKLAFSKALPEFSTKDLIYELSFRSDVEYREVHKKEKIDADSDTYHLSVESKSGMLKVIICK